MEDMFERSFEPSHCHNSDTQEVLLWLKAPSLQPESSFLPKHSRLKFVMKSDVKNLRIEEFFGSLVRGKSVVEWDQKIDKLGCIHIHNKGNRKQCKNCRGILLSSAFLIKNMPHAFKKAAK